MVDGVRYTIESEWSVKEEWGMAGANSNDMPHMRARIPEALASRARTAQLLQSRAHGQRRLGRALGRRSVGKYRSALYILHGRWHRGRERETTLQTQSQ